MIPDPIQNLRFALDRDKPSLTMSWERPSNVDVNRPDELTQYEIFFKPEGQQTFTSHTVPGSSTTLTLTRKSGLVLDPVSQFSVRALNRDRQAGEWITVTQLIGIAAAHLIMYYNYYRFFKVVIFVHQEIMSC